MARGPDFPKVRHLALSTAQRDAGADAVVVPFEAEQPEPPQPAQGAPEGALAAAATDPALRSGAQGAAPAATGAPPPPPAQTPAVARVVVVDLARARDESETCRTPAGAPVTVDGRAVRCLNSAAGLEHAGGVAAWATHLGEAVLLDGLDRWYRLGPAGAGFCRSCELALIEALRESYGDHFEPFDPLGPLRAQPAAEAALAGHRKFQEVVRERFRPSEPLLDLEVLVSPFAEHWGGAHFRTAGACAAALARAHLLLGARLDLSEPRAQVLLLAGCAALPAEDAARARRHVESGGDAIVVGKCATCDEEGRMGPPVFPEAKSGMERVGEGRVYAIAIDSDAPPSPEAQLVRAAREMLGRGRSHLSLSGRARLFARAYLDPERKLDVHLVNLDAPRPAQGVLLHIAGQAAGAGRTGYWFAPERDAGKDGERISLNPSGFSVSTVLPGIIAGALLAVPR